MICAKRVSYYLKQKKKKNDKNDLNNYDKKFG